MKHYSKNTDWEDLEEEVEELFFRPFDVAIKKSHKKRYPQQVSLGSTKSFLEQVSQLFL